MKPARELASSCPKPCASLKKSRNLHVCRYLLAPVQRKQTVVRDQLPPQKPPGSRLVFWSRDVVSAVSPRVAPPIFRSRSEPDAYSQPPLLPPAFRGGMPVLVPSPLVRSVCLVDPTGSAPRMASNIMSLAGHSTPGLLTVSSLVRFGSNPAGRQPGQGVMYLA